jgi:putative peptidoglycan lipid II flippase
VRVRAGAATGVAAGVAGGALVIAVVTVGARAVGLARQLTFTRAAGLTCLNSVYTTANTVPNIVFEVVAGGALAAAVVPAVAAAVQQGDRAATARTVSALLTWTVLLLVPVTLLGYALTGPIVRGLLGGGGSRCSGQLVLMVATGEQMLRVFLVQVPIYGVCVVLAGVLQAHRRFLAPALAPLVSSLVVIGAYATYAVLASGHRGSLTDLSSGERAVLAWGTTAGVVALALTQLPGALRLGLPIRPTLRFPDGVAARVGGLATAAVIVVAAQQASTAVVVRLANTRGTEGALGVWTVAWTVFLLPWAVLAVPLATSAFPRLSASHAVGDETGYATLTAGVARTALLVSAVAGGALAGAAPAVARVVALGVPGPPATGALADAIVAFAPGLLGYALVAHLTRALYARSGGRAATTAAVIGWLLVVIADLVLVPAVSADDVVTALGVGNSVGMTVAGGALLLAVRRSAGPASVAGIPRAIAVSVAVGALGFAVGRGVLAIIGSGESALGSLGLGTVAGLLALVLAAGAAWALARTDVDAFAGALRRGMGR